METISSEDSKSGKSYFAFFDLDQTIIHANSGRLLALEAYKGGMMTSMDLVRGIWLSILYRLNLKDTEKIITDMVSWVTGLPETTLIDLSIRIFDNFLLNAITDNARSEIRFHKEKNAGIVILSSSLSTVCQAVAKHLEMDDVISSKLEVVDGLYTGRPVGKLCFGEEKAVRLREYCKKNNSKVRDAWYYGDSIADFPALKIVGHPVCVNPDKKLVRWANKNDWKICRWK